MGQTYVGGLEAREQGGFKHYFPTQIKLIQLKLGSGEYPNYGVRDIMSMT